MTVNEKIKQALEPFGIPICSDFYGGGEKEYFTFNYADDRAELYGSDAPLSVVASLQIHWFLPRWQSYLQRKREIRSALFGAGFTYPAVPENYVEDDTRHIVFECEIEDDEEPAELEEI